jgi:nucleoside-diphosphate-sugar epimerase
MRKLIKLVRSRLGRGLGLQSLGPNEARILYDGFVSAAGAATALAFSSLFLHRPSLLTIGLHASLPVLLIAFNLALGIYSKLRTAASWRKSVVLLASVLGAAAVGLGLGIGLASITLWVLLVYAPLTLPRLVLELPYTRNPKLSSIAVSRHGPTLVIGGGGYIGSSTVELLLQKGRRVRVLDRLMYGREPLAEFAGRPDFELIEGDVTDIAKLTEAMRGATAVVHLAGLVGDPACAVDPEFTRHTNIIATRMAKDVAQAMGIRRFVFASSCSVYGVSQREVCETDQLNPVSLYAQTKIDSERELLAGLRDDFYTTILRFATVFGDSRRPRFDLVANLFTAQAMTDGLVTVIGPNQRRPFVHVRDLARAIVMVLDADPLQMQNQVFNVGDKRLAMTILQLAERVRGVCKRFRNVELSVTDNPQDRRTYAVCFDKIRSVLGFESETLLEPGIEEMALAFQNGRYGHYRDQIYSNVEMTARALSMFQDPVELSRLYGPLKVR